MLESFVVVMRTVGRDAWDFIGSYKAIDKARAIDALKIHAFTEVSKEDDVALFAKFLVLSLDELDKMLNDDPTQFGFIGGNRTWADVAAGVDVDGTNFPDVDSRMGRTGGVGYGLWFLREHVDGFDEFDHAAQCAWEVGVSFFDFGIEDD